MENLSPHPLVTEILEPVTGEIKSAKEHIDMNRDVLAKWHAEAMAPSDPRYARRYADIIGIKNIIKVYVEYIADLEVIKWKYLVVIIKKGFALSVPKSSRDYRFLRACEEEQNGLFTELLETLKRFGGKMTFAMATEDPDKWKRMDAAMREEKGENWNEFSYTENEKVVVMEKPKATDSGETVEDEQGGKKKKKKNKHNNRKKGKGVANA
ncbi:hypothetical protein K505DRAFT_375789 [Melanomma pulvis-pyrius CBS 109.77]|uniref:Uncharacterized protein n=1 Tax=Melanomma pulvis-pyrius CBS 109.77 TaxID=1314802 RepID=A0A6A6X8I1_9PLEO|nr:hypothetical protein K505DRAFT_375789 [Melanomma pulvis-pyrius CBS 109.77]